MTDNQKRNEVLKAKAVSGLTKGVAAGAGFALFDAFLSVGAFATEAVVIAAEASVIVPAVLTTAAVGATAYGGYKAYKHLTK